jgi:hypothetical protein
MINVILGLVMIVGGASGKLALIGTNSGGALLVVGIGVTLYGVFQIVRARSVNKDGIE